MRTVGTCAMISAPIALVMATIESESEMILYRKMLQIGDVNRRLLRIGDVKRQRCSPICTPNCSQSSRPGKPCLPAAMVWPFRSNTEWRSDLGERIVQAVTPTLPDEACGGYHLFGDHTFCVKAMMESTAVALSYGIEKRDLWSELMSNVFHVPPCLHDCSVPPRSPLIAATAPNGTNATGFGNCKNAKKACYEMPYKAFSICLWQKSGRMTGRNYETLESHLEGLANLSAYIKMDVEGVEWQVLERLLSNQTTMRKIRTLDVEFHFGFPCGETAELCTGQEQLEAEVRILERLSQHFNVTGSNLEVYREGWHPEDDCKQQQCIEPLVHTSGGFGVAQFSASFVNSELLATPAS
mmetsp:Transcript_41554/g.82223  ORF Transcript_41554/g.82223 Transcript_41554/m.82223 type:complete len:354 (-) Transcript_41554:54-1115(-)